MSLPSLGLPSLSLLLLRLQACRPRANPKPPGATPRTAGRLLAAGLTLLALELAGCTSMHDPQRIAPLASSPERAAQVDPLEPFNRQMLRFNLFLDDVILRPAARVYDHFMPELAQRAVENILGNLHDPWIAANGLLQGKPGQAASDLARFVFNSTLGFFGVVDLASEIGFPKHREDFGQTLATWGVPAGPYLMLPGLGPSSIRDSLAFGVDYTGSLKNHVDSGQARAVMSGLDVLQSRARALPAQPFLEQALDRYLLIRDSHLQRRRSQIYDGDPPDTP